MRKISLAIAMLLLSFGSAFAVNSAPNPNGVVPLSVKGAVTPNDCAKFVNGSVIADAGSTCGGGSGTVSVGTAGYLGYYASTGTTISPLADFNLRSVPSNQWSGVSVYGADESVPFTNALYTPDYITDYGSLVAKQLGTAPNYYVFGDYTGPEDGFTKDSCDVVEEKVIPNTTPGLEGNPIGLELVESGEASYGAGNYQAHLTDTQTCLTGGLTWSTVPQDYKVNANTFTASGAWAASTHYSNANANGVTTTENGDTLSGTVTTYGGPIYLWFLMHVSDGGTFTVAVDGGTPVSVNTQGQGATSNPAFGGLSYTYGGVRLPVAAAGSHTISITVTSATSASNTVTIEGFGTPPGKAYASTSPVFVLSGMLPNNTYPAVSTAFNTMQQSLTTQLKTDGLQTLFAPIANYYNASTDITTFTVGSSINSTGQQHISDAFNGVIQGLWNSMFAVNPLQFGASCNVKMFTNNFNSAGNHAVTTTAGSPVVSVANYLFQPGVATQFGGGDVGKVWVPAGSDDNGQTTYILSVNTSNNTATLGENMAVNATGAFALMGGYPSNPNDPSTAQDDTNAIQLASQAAALGGGIVSLPPNCGVHNLVMATNTALVGNNGGNNYNAFSGYPTFINTPLYVMATGFVDDYDNSTGTNVARSVGIDTTRSSQVKLKDFDLVCPNFPYLPTGMYLAGIGEQTPTATGIQPDHILIDHLTISDCPVAFDMPLGNNFPVTFTASISGTTMSVSAITSTNFNVLPTGNGNPLDFLSIGRTFTGTGVPANETITSVPIGTTIGNYGVSVGTSVSSTTMTSTPPASFTSGTMQNTQMATNGLGINGSLSDFTWTNNIGTNYFQCVFLGPPSGSAGTSANRFLGGRCETGGGMLFDGGGDDQLTGVQFQATRCAIQTIGSGSHLQITGGWMQGNDCDNTNSNYSQILIGGSWTNIDISGVSADFNNYGGGYNHQSKYFLETAVGSTADYISIEGGEMRQGFTTAFTLFTNQTPTHYKQNVPGLALIDTTQTTQSMSAAGNIGIGTSAAVNPLDVYGAVAIGTGYASVSTAPVNGLIVKGEVGIGTALPAAGIALDLSNTTGALALPVGTTGQEPANPHVGWVRYNSSVPQAELYTSGSWTALATGTGYVQTGNNNVFTGNNSYSGTSTYTGSLVFPFRVVTASGAVTVSATTDYEVIINKTVGAATTVNLPSPVNGMIFIIKDGKGDANVNNITVTPQSGTIDGASTYVINTAYGVAAFLYNGTQWNQQ